MPTSGLVATLDRDPALRSSVLGRLGEDERWTLGELQGDRMPLVCQATDPDRHAHALDALAELAGVVLLELVFSDFSDLAERAAEHEARPDPHLNGA